MQKLSIYTLKIKRNIIPIIFLCFTFCLLFFSSSNLPAVRNGLSLFGNSVVPSLLPFFIATEMLMHTNIVNQIGYILNPIMKPLFNVSRKRSIRFCYGAYFRIPSWS